MSSKLSVAIYCIGSEWIPSTRFRITQYFPQFAREGIRVKLFALPAGKSKGRVSRALLPFVQFAIRAWQLLWAWQYDCIVVQKGLTPWRGRALPRLLGLFRKPFVFDLDDAVFLGNTVSLPGFFRKLQDDEEPLRLIQSAQCVIAGNEYLAEFCRRHNANCVMIPTAIDTNVYQASPCEENSRLIIGWSGSPSTNHYVNLLIPVLNRLAQKNDFDFHMISSDQREVRTEQMSGYGFHFFRWTPQDEIENMRAFDIGVMPLVADAWSQGKCALKALQYMALAIPAVCSPVGVNADIIQDGKNGFLASSEQDWYERLEGLLKSADLRRTVGRAGRETVESKYSVKVNFPIFLETLNKAAVPKNNAAVSASGFSR